MAPRRFPAPWRVEEHPESFIVRDASGQALAYVYFAEDQRAMVTQRLDQNGAYKIARAITRLPYLLAR